jgi:hypothetical protein
MNFRFTFASTFVLALPLVFFGRGLFLWTAESHHWDTAYPFGYSRGQMRALRQIFFLAFVDVGKDLRFFPTRR